MAREKLKSSCRKREYQGDLFIFVHKKEGYTFLCIDMYFYARKNKILLSFLKQMGYNIELENDAPVYQEYFNLVEFD